MPRWRPKLTAPTWRNCPHPLKYMQNWVTMIEDGMDLGNGCIYLIGDKGLIWRNFVKKVEKYIWFGAMRYYKIHTSDVPGIKSYFHVELIGPVITTCDEELESEVRSSQDTDNRSDVGSSSDDSLMETQPLQPSRACYFVLQNECDLRELRWYVNVFWKRWTSDEYDSRPSDEELHPPGQFDDAQFPKTCNWSADEKEAKEWAIEQYEHRIRKFGPPENHKGRLTGGHVEKYPPRGQCTQVKYPNIYGGMAAMVKFAKTSPNGFWWGPKKQVSHKKDEALKLKLEVAKGMYADSPDDPSGNWHTGYAHVLNQNFINDDFYDNSYY